MNLIERLLVRVSGLETLADEIAKVYSNMVFCVFCPEFLQFCMDHYVDPDTKRIGISVRRLADLAGVSAKAISNWLKRKEDGSFIHPDRDAKLKLGKTFGLIFVDDWTETVTNDLVMQIVKAQHPYAVSVR